MNSAKRNPVPKEPGRWRALLLAGVVHGLLFAFLWIGVRWQSETPVAFEAEVWSPQPREAAPPQPVPPPPKPEPPPVVKPVPTPPVPEVKPPVVKPDIVLEQEKKRKAQQKEQKEREEKKAAAEKKKAEEKKRIEQEKLAQAEKKKREDLAKKEAEKKRKEEEAEEKLRTAAREEEMKRIAAAAGSGDAPRTQGSRTDPGYMQRIGAKIKSNTVAINVPDNVSASAAVEYLVELLPDGSLRQATLKKPSGVPGFDEAVLRAIEKSAPYPADKSGRVPPNFTVIHRPKDQ